MRHDIGYDRESMHTVMKICSMSITNRTVPSNNEIYSGIYALHDVGDAFDASLFIFFYVRE